MYPKLLLEVQDFLIGNTLSFPEYTEDGRTNSTLYRKEIIEKLSKEFGSKINYPKVRDWFSFSFKEEGEFFPVNIKVSTMNTADNLNCRLGIYFALTGKIPPFDNEVDWEEYFKALQRDLEFTQKDYYFLIINKNNPKDVILNSLKGLKKINPNGNNLPFQAKWSENRERVSRTYDEAKDFILRCFSQSLRLRVNAYNSFLGYFKEYQ